MTSMWINFAKTGTPMIANVNWTPVAKDPASNLNILRIASPTEVLSEALNEREEDKFWNSLLPTKKAENLDFSKDEL